LGLVGKRGQSYKGSATALPEIHGFLVDGMPTKTVKILPFLVLQYIIEKFLRYFMEVPLERSQE